MQTSRGHCEEARQAGFDALQAPRPHANAANQLKRHKPGSVGSAVGGTQSLCFSQIRDGYEERIPPERDSGLRQRCAQDGRSGASQSVRLCRLGGTSGIPAGHHLSRLLRHQDFCALASNLALPTSLCTLSPCTQQKSKRSEQ